MWVDAGYIGVWHLGEQDPDGWTVGTLVDGVVGYSRDSSANALHGTNNVYSSHRSDGAIGGARYMATGDAASRHGAGVCVPGWADYMAENGHFSSHFTASVWIRRQGLSNKDAVYYETILGTKSDMTGKVSGWAFGLTTSYSQLLVFGDGAGNKKVAPMAGSKQGGDWQKYDVVYTSTRDVYTNGVPQSVGTTGAGGASNSGLALGIGTHPSGAGGGWLGDLDEVRIASVVRSEDWIAADYDTVGDPGFLVFGPVVSDAASLIVSGDPGNLGTADPAYGTITAIAAGDAFTASVTATNPLASGVERWVCTGYTHYQITDAATGAKTVAQQGNAASFAYTHVGQDELVWHFTNEWLVSVSSTDGGFVSISEAWVRNAEPVALVATPDEGYDFWGWTGDTDGIPDVSSASIAPVVASARSLKAVFVSTGANAAVQYVATTGDDANSGYFEESPKLTVQAAVDTLANAPGFGTVYVAPGTYVYAGTVAITNAIAVLGAADGPEKVVLRAGNVANNQNRIALQVNHAGALVANLSIENGHRSGSSSPYGGNVSIGASGGTVSNCVLRGAAGAGNYALGMGAWLNSPAALLTHCVVTNNSALGSGYAPSNDPYGLFVHVEKGTVANCLVANNHDTGGHAYASNFKQAYSCGVSVKDGILLNCSVVTNEARYTGGIYLGSNGYATNVVVAGCVNNCSYTNGLGEIGWTDVGFKGTLANASHCASDGGEALGDTCVAGTMQTFFRDAAARDYRPRAESPLVDKGVAYEGIAAIDLLGRTRAQGRPDIGCYENSARGTLIVVK